LNTHGEVKAEHRVKTPSPGAVTNTETSLNCPMISRSNKPGMAQAPSISARCRDWKGRRKTPGELAPGAGSSVLTAKPENVKGL